MSFKQQKINLLIFPIIALLIVLLFYPGSQGDFWFDDTSNILENHKLPLKSLNIEEVWSASLSGMASSIGRPVSMLSFALNSYFSQFDPYAYKITNIIFHIINTFLIFLLATKILSLAVFKDQLRLPNQHITILAFSISIIWAITPINAVNVLYVVQRMNELSTLFILASLLLFLKLRTSNNISILRQVIFFILLSLLLLLAVLAKENGALLVGFIILVEIILRSNSATANKRSALNNPFFFYLVVVFLIFLPSLLAGYWLLTHFEQLLDGYQLRNFSLSERLLSQPRILFYYLQQTFLPNINFLTFYHDDFIPSTSLLTPISTIFAIVTIIVGGLLAVLKRQSWPFLFFGLVWFLIGHSMESSIIPLELVFEHRNYLPSFGPIFMSVLFFYLLTRRLNLSRYNPIFISTYILILAILCYFSTSNRGNSIIMLQTFVQEHPRSARSHLAWAVANEKLFLIDQQNNNYLDKAILHTQLATNLDPDLINGLIYSILLKLNYDIPATTDLEQLKTRLSTIKTHSSNTRVLRRIFNFALQKPNKLSHTQVTSLVQHYLSNQSLKGRTKAIFYKDYANYLIATKGLNLKVIHLLTDAVNELPKNLELKIFLISGLIQLGQIPAAEQLLVHLEKQDRFKQHHNSIQNLKKRIKQQKNLLHDKQS